MHILQPLPARRFHGRGLVPGAIRSCAGPLLIYKDDDGLWRSAVSPSGYLGVTKNAQCNTFYARLNGKRLGGGKTAREAAIRYARARW